MLATKVALRHSEDRTLLYDLKATYSWLNKNVEDAREALVNATDIPLFLNVVDPLTTEWIGNWQPASKLVLNLTEDYGTWKAVRPFLHEYEALLLATGCKKLNSLKRTKRQPSAETLDVAVDLAKQFSEMRREGREYEDLLAAGCKKLNSLKRNKRQPSAETLGVAVDLAKQFSEMRREGRLTDLFFEPIIHTADDESSDSQELAAHKVFLAATLPYFRDKFEHEKRGILEDLMSSATEWNIPPNDHDVGFTALLEKFLETTPPDKLFRSQNFKFEGTHFAAKLVLGICSTFTNSHVLIFIRLV